MSRLFVVDASAFKIYYDELIDDIDGIAAQAFGKIFVNDCIAIDESNRMISEWIKCSCGDQDEFLRSWLRARAEEDKIRVMNYKPPQGMRSQLDKFGVPNKDRVYLYFSAFNNAHLIISEDIHFYDPKAKSHTHEKKQDLKLNSSGCVCKYMKSAHSVGICVFQCLSEHV